MTCACHATWRTCVAWTIPFLLCMQCPLQEFSQHLLLPHPMVFSCQDLPFLCLSPCYFPTPTCLPYLPHLPFAFPTPPTHSPLPHIHLTTWRYSLCLGFLCLGQFTTVVGPPSCLPAYYLDSHIPSFFCLLIALHVFVCLIRMVCASPATCCPSFLAPFVLPAYLPLPPPHSPSSPCVLDLLFGLCQGFAFLCHTHLHGSSTIATFSPPGGGFHFPLFPG